MKRQLTAGLLLLGALLLTTPAFAHGGPGGGYGMGPGMMGGGMGPGMMGLGPLGMHPELTQLPPEKQEQLRKLHLSLMEAMIPKRAELQVKRLALADTMRTFPLDQQAARAQRAAVEKARQELFDLRLNAMTQVQQIVGRELWDRMHTGAPCGMGGFRGGPGARPGMGPGTAPGGMGGPGMMGPQQPR